MRNSKNNNEWNWKVIAGTFNTIVSTIIVLAILFSMGNDIVITDEKVKISGISGIAFDKKNIVSVELLESMPEIITKLTDISEGFASKYKLDNGEEAYVYKGNGKQDFIKIVCKNEIIYISFSKEKAQETYNELIKFINKKGENV